MRVTVEVLGGETHEVELEEPTYDDLVRAVDLHPQEATALVDGRHVPGDAPVESDHVQVVRLIHGGCGPTGTTAGKDGVTGG